MNKESSRRVESLDSFRGIASVLIMLTHFIIYVPEVFQVENLSLIYGWLSWKLPYFFVLSGFVLALSYMRSRERDKRPFKNFIINRIFRIYPIFILSTVAMFVLKVAFDAGCDIEGASRFYNISWRITPTVVDLIHALTLVGFSDTWSFNGPAWTLVFEMRYALIFPLFLAMLRKSWSFILLFVALSAMAYNINAGLEKVDIFYAVNFQLSNVCSMFNYLLFYLSGIVLALNRDRFSQIYNSFSNRSKYLTLLVAILFVLAPIWVGAIVPMVIAEIAINVVILIGLVIWIVILLNNSVISKIFSQKILIAIGRSSFSIYMWHTPIFTLLYMLFKDSINIWVIIPIAVILTFVIAQLSFRYIEQPFIAMGHRITRR